MGINDDIGALAGEIWRYLDENGDTTTLRLRLDLKIPHSRLFLALGWLLREGKAAVVFEEQGCRASIKR